MSRFDRRLLGGRSAAGFLRGYWQKRPLLVRGAFPGFRDPIAPEELLHLACRDDVESRLVLARGGKRPFRTWAGPQDPRRLSALPATHWTLLVQGVDRHRPGVRELRDRFSFVPDWRIDDVMVSLAPRGGTVGPHVDSYDVFLLQGLGRRRWRVQQRPEMALRPGLDLQVLRRFVPDEEWTLEPGDLLYVPPGVAHHGVALADCLTYSIGFRAPAHAELVAAVFPRLLRAIPASRVYADPDRRPAREPAEIAEGDLRRLRRIVRDELGPLQGLDLDRVIGETLTEPKETEASPAPRARRVSASEVRARLARGAVVVRSPASRLAFAVRGGEADLFVDGRCHSLPRPLAFAARLLTGRSRLDAGALRPHLRARGFASLLAELVNDGAFALVRP